MDSPKSTSGGSGSEKKSSSSNNNNGSPQPVVNNNSSQGAIKRTNIQQSSSVDHLNDEHDNSSSQILERVKSDRVAVTKPEEDWRRRTIIVEKKNGTYGFTLQSYGIHYKKEQEIEMITYVDYVDFDGPAYRAGMREGDVILSINGTDMEKSDHKSLVNFIKNCDNRMRMVVLFEDCVRKVELHIRYLELQKMLQEKVNEMERLCIKEKELLDGKWKTHSLPSQRKKTSCNDGDVTPTDEDPTSYPYCRPTVSTEDVASKNAIMTYQYLDPGYRTYILQPSTSRAGDYVVSLGPPRSRSDHHHFIVKTPCTGQAINITTRQIQVNHSSNGTQTVFTNKPKKHHHHRCNPCYPPPSNPDNASLEAYDLASPCCDPHCVPSARRRSRHHKHCEKEHHHRKKDKHKHGEPSKRESSSQTRSKSTHCQTPAQQAPGKYHYFNLGPGLVSQCSLQSSISSEMSVTVPTCESFVTSYTTSLSSDTLYWENASEPRHTRSSPKVQNPAQHNHTPQYQTHCKPKSWDNLTTKAFGGYGFGYGYSDTSSKHNHKGHSRAHSTKSAHESRSYRHSATERQIQHGIYIQQQQQQQQQHSHQRCTPPPTKSTENLLSVSKYHSNQISDSSISCECLETVSPSSTLKSNASSRFFQRNSYAGDHRSTGYYSQHIPRAHLRGHNIPQTSSEITRL